jgi:hypothetical protein
VVALLPPKLKSTIEAGQWYSGHVKTQYMKQEVIPRRAQRTNDTKSETHNKEISIFNLLPHNKIQSINTISFIYTPHARSRRVILISREHFRGGVPKHAPQSLRSLHRYDTKPPFTGRHQQRRARSIHQGASPRLA